ncbi:sigma-70 family RNA polymerase sigma factor [Nocardiopsis xinjiangensis]|uniref:sigma-70 family RNA polymerase sigma factor n=1 Tax=Nocardiopsis xinjiangensis TaxID=124285 RepID=UPI0003812A5F|nr:sigma-70 family RNA polymerase sigma factor [Nocardiopsis xinjiangensis]
MARPTLDPDFTEQVEPFRRELLAHCYRMLGSLHEAEDCLQEIHLRAWKGYARFEGRSSLRTWLHRIASNVCLSALERRERRPLPTGLGGPAERPEAALAERTDVPWLEPLPDDPGTVAAERESVRLAWVAALQYLNARQRAVLVLREALRLSAAEVADLLELSVPSVNSLLQRARESIARAAPDQEALSATDPALRERLARYVAAFEDYDIPALTTLFTDDAVFEMPPFTTWVRGAEHIVRLIEAHCPAQGPGDLALVPVAANGAPGFALYMREGQGPYRAFALQVLEPAPEGFSRVVQFFDTTLFPRFGLEPVLRDRPRGARATTLDRT